jgi:pyruvate dehydrogenase E1 component beta subunit
LKKREGLQCLHLNAYIVQERAFDFLDAPIQKNRPADTPAPYPIVERMVAKWMM